MIPLWLARTAHVMILALPRNTLLAHLYKHKVFQAITAGILFSAPSFSRGGNDLFFGACGLRAATHLCDDRQGINGVLVGEVEVVERGEAHLGNLIVTQHEAVDRSEEHTSELQSLMRSPYAVFCL